MAGARIEVDNAQVLGALGELLDRLENVDPALRDIGEHLLNTTRERFGAQVSPDGTPWAPLSAAYAARKQRKNPNAGILVLDGYLFGGLRYDVEAGELELGTDRIYGATHQFGDEARNIPDRAFLGLSESDTDEVLAIVQEYLDGAAS